MAAKYQLITEIYRSTGIAVTKNPQAWQSFLSSACRNYKCRFDEQLLIYAQRPDAIAVARIETWNKRFKRWVNKDSKGIAVFDNNGRNNTLKYYFDISDTQEGFNGSIPVPIWKMDKQYEQAVIERLSDNFGNLETDGMGKVLMQTAQNAVEDNLSDYFSQLKDNKKDSFLEELDDFNVEVIYKRLAVNSVAYMLMTRCGIDTKEYFDTEDFADIVNFNTPETLNAIGIATSDISEMALREISSAIRDVQLEEKKQNRTFAQIAQSQYDKVEIQLERGENNEQNHLQQAGGLSYSRPNITDRARTSAWQVRYDAQGLSGTEQESNVSQSADIGQAEQTTIRSGTDSTQEIGASNKTAYVGTRRDRGIEREKPNAMDRNDEQHPQSGGGSDPERIDLQLTEENTGELPAFLNEKLIMAILSNRDDDLKYKKKDIELFFSTHPNEKERAEYLKSAYQDRYTEILVDDVRVGYKPQEDGLLMWEGAYLSHTKESVFSWQLVAEWVAELIDKEKEVTSNLPTVDEQIEMIVEAEKEKSSAFSVSQKDIDSVLLIGSGFENGKYRIYRQFSKYEDSKKNIAFLKKEYGTGGGTHTYPDGTDGDTWHSSKGIAIEKYGSYTNPDILLSWSKVEKRLRELIKDDRYLNSKEKDHYADYLNSVSAPQYEIDTQRKLARQRFIESKSELPPAEKRDSLALRLSDFIRDLDGYEKDLLANVERTDLADVTDSQMEQYLSEPETVQQLIDFFSLLQKKTADVYSRSNAYRFSQELKELHPMHYLCHEGDIVYIGADKYEVITLTEGNAYLQNTEFPLLSKEMSLNDLEKKLSESPDNDHLKVVVTETQKKETLTEKKPDSLTLSISFSEHPAFYDRDLKDRFTKLSFPLGNRLFGILDEKQHRERGGDKSIGWYHKTDFEIIAVIDGEDFQYEGRFDIGDGEGDLIAHIKNFYDYYLSPDCPFIPEWKREGEDYFQKKIESLRWGRDVFVPYLEQHTELTPEDEKQLAEIMATESDWFRTEEQEYTDTLNKAKQETLKDKTNDTASDNIVGKEITIDNRQYIIESVGENSDDVSMRDITFQNSAGFPINRVEKIGYIQRLLEQQSEKELPPEEKEETAAEPVTETVAEYPAMENGLPYDIVVEKIRFDKPEQKQEKEVPVHSEERNNFRIINDTLGDEVKANAGFSPKEKFRNNIAAIHLLHDLQIENRLATPEEQETLSKYVGWGGLSMAFDEKNATWANEYKELKSVLSDEEYRSAMESTLTAFYTPPVVIKAMYEALDRLGFSQGNILEPSCGTGNFFGLLPDGMVKSKLYGIEIDPLSGMIAKQLYQKANISIEGFENTKLPDNHFDVILGNVPFGEFKVNDNRYNSHKFFIHDYFIAKSLDKVRAGGVVMFLTSKGTMDKASPEVRKYIAQRAELLGAIRLPDDTFKANAGTEVTSDILILQKRDRVMDIEPDWVYLDTDKNGITMNSYFIQHPEMIMGEMKMESTRFGMDSACKAHKDIPLSELLHEAVQKINGDIPEYENEIDEISDEQDASIPSDPDVRNFSFTLVDGKVYFRENDKMTPANLSITAENRIKGLIGISDCVRRLIQYQTDDYPEEMIYTEQENLNRLYDEYTAKYGIINSRGNYLAFASDESYFLLCSLEVLDDEGKFKRKADMFTKRTIKPHREVTFVETASEALALSIGEKACVDLEYMSQLTGKTQKEIIQNLQGVIFRVPNSEPASYVTADEYLSGNVRNKLVVAETAAKSDLELNVNVEALKKVIPKDLPASEIAVRLGTTWIPQEDIQQFMTELLTPSSYAMSRLKVRYMPMNGDWFIENKRSDIVNVKANSTYGTKRASAYRIIEDTLNLRDTRIFDYVYDEEGKKKAVLNHKETTAAQAKQEAIKQAFQDWIWKDPERRNRLVRYYNDTFNSVRPREYDGSHITFSGISPDITLRPHQVNAIAHILYGGNTLLAHKVGAGKTFEMVAAAQESKRLGLCNKSMFVVPNHLVGQWASEYLRLYPSANILVTRKQDFETANRKKFCSRIATGDYDAIIIGHSQFEKIPMSIEKQREQLERQLDDIERGIDDVQASHGEQFTVKQLMKTRKAIKSKLEKLNDTKRKDNVINFEELGVDRLFIDESHFYKNLYLYTKMRNVGGIAQTEAQKSSDLFMKCRYLDEITGGRGTIFATGTPISNSMVEMYSLQRYLQYDTLVKNGLQHFDSWASTFGETVTALELSPEGTNYRAKTRFAKFYNLPELMQMFKEVADIQTADMLKLPVPKVNYHNIKTKPSEIQSKMVAELAQRAEKVRASLVEPNVDNMLKITNDGRKLALDQRLINPMLPDDPDSKVNSCVDNVYRIWEEYTDTKAAQLVFCDLSTPKNDDTFNVYDDMREKLIERGIPAKQVRFIHEATTDAQKKELFAKVRSGEVRILFGSTQKMGAGTNVQDRLIAIHNLDCPWRPSDWERAPVKAA